MSALKENKVIITDLSLGWRLECGKAQVDIIPGGDEVCEIKMSGVASLRDWWMLGSRIKTVGQSDYWADGVHNNEAAWGGSGDQGAVLLGHSGTWIMIGFVTDEGEDAEIKLGHRKVFCLSVKADAFADKDQLQSIGDMLTSVIEVLLKAPMGLFNQADVVATAKSWVDCQ